MNQPKSFALILAGGSGTRFWPLSRNEKPKQLLKLFDEETLIEKTVNRLDGLVPIENIIVLTNASQVEGIEKALPDLPRENIVAEPARRDTARNAEERNLGGSALPCPSPTPGGAPE